MHDVNCLLFDQCAAMYIFFFDNKTEISFPNIPKFHKTDLYFGNVFKRNLPRLKAEFHETEQDNGVILERRKPVW